MSGMDSDWKDEFAQDFEINYGHCNQNEPIDRSGVQETCRLLRKDRSNQRNNWRHKRYVIANEAYFAKHLKALADALKARGVPKELFPTMRDYLVDSKAALNQCGHMQLYNAEWRRIYDVE